MGLPGSALEPGIGIWAPQRDCGESPPLRSVRIRGGNQAAEGQHRAPDRGDPHNVAGRVFGHVRLGIAQLLKRRAKARGGSRSLTHQKP